MKMPRGAVAFGENDAWIVGSRGLEGGVMKTAAQRWDGARWRLVSTPNVGTGGENSLSDVDGVSPSSAWAVGYSTSGDAEGGGKFKTLVQRWNGTAWNIVPSPNAGATTDSNALTAVDAVAENDVWAVGYRRSGTVRSTLVERWNGSAWNIVPSPDPGPLGNALLGVATTATGTVWAVGWQLGPDGIRSLTMRWNGSAWGVVPTPTVGTADNVLTGVATTGANEVWAVGYAVDGTRHVPLVLHHDGVSWTHTAPPVDAPDIGALRGVVATSPDGVWAVGAAFRPTSMTYGPWSQSWNGSGWTSHANATATNRQNTELLAIAHVPGRSQLWAAGRIAVIETICPAPAAASMTATGAATSTGTDDATSTGIAAKSGAEPVAETAAVTAEAVAVEARDVSVAAGIAQTTKTRGAVIADFTGDGKPDIFLGRHQSAARMYRNDDGRFTEIHAGTFRATDRHGCDAADVDGSGTLDIACAVGAAHGTIMKRDELYLQAGDGTFSDQAWRYGVLEPYARGRSSTFVDADGVGGPDLFVANFPDRADGLPSVNRLFINDGGAYRTAPRFGLEVEVDSGNPSGSNPLAEDMDGDGWEDIVMDTAKGLIVYRNMQGGSFRNVAGSIGLTVNPVDVALADVDGDHDLDLVSLKKLEVRVFRNDGGTFRSVSVTKIQDGKAVATGDVNGDDRADIYVVRGGKAGTNAPDLVLLNGGTGTTFSSLGPIPSATTGVADSAWPIDHDGNGLTDFLVLDGKSAAGGPVRLLAFYPA